METFQLPKRKRKERTYEDRKEYVSGYNKRLYAAQRLFRKMTILFIRNEKAIPEEEKTTFVGSLDETEQKVFYDWLKKLGEHS